MSGPISSKTTEEKKRKQTEGRSQPDARRSISHGPEADMLALQDAAGNRAVSGLLQAKRIAGQSGDQEKQEADRESGTATRPSEPANRRGPRTTPYSVGGNYGIPRKIKTGRPEVSQPNDEYEQEADRMANRVTRMSDMTVEFQFLRTSKTLPSRPHALRTSVLGISSGVPLPNSVRRFFEPRFGSDFSHVRIHKNQQDAKIAQSLNARAFVVGKDVVFGDGEYAPGSEKGKRLLAHELTHVIQQEYIGPMIQRQTGAERYPPTGPSTRVSTPEITSPKFPDPSDRPTFVLIRRKVPGVVASVVNLMIKGWINDELKKEVRRRPNAPLESKGKQQQRSPLRGRPELIAAFEDLAQSRRASLLNDERRSVKELTEAADKESARLSVLLVLDRAAIDAIANPIKQRERLSLLTTRLFQWRTLLKNFQQAMSQIIELESDFHRRINAAESILNYLGPRNSVRRALVFYWLVGQVGVQPLIILRAEGRLRQFKEVQVGTLRSVQIAHTVLARRVSEFSAALDRLNNDIRKLNTKINRLLEIEKTVRTASLPTSELEKLHQERTELLRRP